MTPPYVFFETAQDHKQIMECQICHKKGEGESEGADAVDVSCFLCGGALCTVCFMKYQTRQKCVLCKKWWFVDAEAATEKN